MKYICLHNTAVRNSGYKQLNGVDDYHRDKWNMKSKLGWYVGYNYFIDTDATLTQCREVGEETIAQVGHNCNVPEKCDTISVCMSGYFKNDKPTEAQTYRLREFVTELRRNYPNTLEVVGHRDLQENRTCPEVPQSYIDQFNMTQEEQLDLLNKLLDKLRRLVALLLKLKPR